MKYDAAYGGHAPGYLRDAFLEAIDAYENWQNGEPQPTVDVRDRPVPIADVCGLVWNCTDILPNSVCSQLDNLFAHGENFRAGGTYAQGARLLKSLIAKAAS